MSRLMAGSTRHNRGTKQTVAKKANLNVGATSLLRHPDGAVSPTPSTAERRGSTPSAVVTHGDRNAFRRSVDSSGWWCDDASEDGDAGAHPSGLCADSPHLSKSPRSPMAADTTAATTASQPSACTRTLLYVIPYFDAMYQFGNPLFFLQKMLSASTSQHALPASGDGEQTVVGSADEAHHHHNGCSESPAESPTPILGQDGVELCVAVSRSSSMGGLAQRVPDSPASDIDSGAGDVDDGNMHVVPPASGVDSTIRPSATDRNESGGDKAPLKGGLLDQSLKLNHTSFLSQWSTSVPAHWGPGNRLPTYSVFLWGNQALLCSKT